MQGTTHRKRFILGVAATLTIALLGACGPRPADDPSTPTVQPSTGRIGLKGDQEAPDFMVLVLDGHRSETYLGGCRSTGDGLACVDIFPQPFDPEEAIGIAGPTRITIDDDVRGVDIRATRIGTEDERVFHLEGGESFDLDLGPGDHRLWISFDLPNDGEGFAWVDITVG
jgi:hypothetical protein